MIARARVEQEECASSSKHLARVEEIPEGLLELLVGDLTAAELLPQLEDEPEDLLVGKTVEGTGETVEAGGEGEVGVGEGAADEVGGVGRDVAALVVRVEDEVEAHEVDELLVLEAELVGVVSTHVELGVGGDELAAVVDVAVDLSGGPGQEGDEVEHVLVGVLPVLGLVDAIEVSLGELALGLEGVDTDGELGHGVHGAGQVLEDVRDVSGELLRALADLVDEVLRLLLSRDLAGEEEPQEGLGERLLAVLGLGQLGLALGDRVAPEADALQDGKGNAFEN